MTYYYAFIDADQCYSYSGEVYNGLDKQKVYINDNGHETLYEADPSGCWNQFTDLTYGEEELYWDMIDEHTYDEESQTTYTKYYDACTDDYYFLHSYYGDDGDFY